MIWETESTNGWILNHESPTDRNLRLSMERRRQEVAGRLYRLELRDRQAERASIARRYALDELQRTPAHPRVRTR